MNMPPEVTLLDGMIREHARNNPRRIAVIQDQRTLSYEEWNKAVDAFAQRLLAQGLKRGGHVGLLSANSIPWVIAFFGVLRGGGVAVPLDPSQGVGALSRVAEDGGLSFIYADGEHEKKARDIAMGLRGKPAVLGTAVESWQGKENPVFPKRSSSDLALILYTSGSTARPVGVMLSHRNLFSNAGSVVQYLRLTGDDRISCVLPFHYIYGISQLLTHALVGGSIVIENRFAYPNTVLDGMIKHGATGFAGVSSHYAILFSQSDFESKRFPRLRYFAQAGDAMPPSLARRLADTFPDKEIYLMYGQTEASPRLTSLHPRLVSQKPGSVGGAIPGVEIRIVDSSGGECAAGEEGEIITRGDHVMMGYWNAPEETARVLKGGWLYTGDLAVKDSDGDLYIRGRKENLLKVGGERVHPSIIEKVITDHEAVLEAAVVGVPDPFLGTRLESFVTLEAHKSVSEQDLLKHCRERLSPATVPYRILILKTMPRNSGGKIDRAALSERSKGDVKAWLKA